MTFDAAERNENLAAFNARKENSRKGKRGVNPLQKNSYSQSKRQSDDNNLSKDRRMRAVRCSGRAEKEGQLVALAGNQNPSPKAPPKCKGWQK